MRCLDVASGMARFLHELGIAPAIIATGTESKEFVKDVQAVASQTGHEIEIISGCDLYELHEAVKAVGVDLVMGTRTGSTSLMTRGSPSHESGLQCMIGLATREERSSGTAAGSILSIGLRTRFWIMGTRRECMVLFGMGMLILAVLCGVEGVRILFEILSTKEMAFPWKNENSHLTVRSVEKIFDNAVRSA